MEMNQTREDFSLERRMLSMEHNVMAIQSRIGEMEGRHERDHRILVEGNGDLPIVEKVRVLETFRGSVQFWFRTIAVALVIQTITFVTAAAVYFVRLIPVLDALSEK